MQKLDTEFRADMKVMEYRLSIKLVFITGSMIGFSILAMTAIMKMLLHS